MRILIVDDEPLSLRLLDAALRELDGVEVVGTASDGETALDEARRLRPDLVILDVEMPGRDGLSVAAELARAGGPEIVLLSAFDHYAAAAFEVEALDYLLKPLRSDRLAQAIARARHRRAESTVYAAAMSERRHIDTAVITVPDRHGGRDIPVSKIVWIEAARDYAIIHTRLRSHMMRITMKEIATLLPPLIRRVRRSTCVNLAEVRNWSGPVKGTYSLLLSDGTSIAVGPTYLMEVREALRSLRS